MKSSDRLDGRTAVVIEPRWGVRRDNDTDNDKKDHLHLADHQHVYVNRNLDVARDKMRVSLLRRPSLRVWQQSKGADGGAEGPQRPRVGRKCLAPRHMITHNPPLPRWLVELDSGKQVRTATRLSGMGLQVHLRQWIPIRRLHEISCGAGLPQDPVRGASDELNRVLD